MDWLLDALVKESSSNFEEDCMKCILYKEPYGLLSGCFEEKKVLELPRKTQGLGTRYHD